MQRHYVEIFDMKRRACPFLTYWTNGDTRNRGVAILRFKQAYAEAGFTLGTEELPDHLAVVLEFAAVGDRVTGDALLAEHAAAIGLLREALHDLGSAYSPRARRRRGDAAGGDPRGGRADGRSWPRPARPSRTSASSRSRPRSTPTGARR